MELALHSTAVEPGKILVTPYLLDGPATSGRTLAMLRTLEASSTTGPISAAGSWSPFGAASAEDMIAAAGALEGQI